MAGTSGSGIIVVLMTAGGRSAAESRVVVAHGGEVVKRLDDDGCMSVFASAADGVRCAGELGRLSHGVRVGVSAGEATQEAGDWFGRPVVEAARLCAAAAPGQVLLTPIVVMLAGSRLGALLVDPVGDLDLKGLGVVAGVVALRADDRGGDRPPPPTLTDEHDPFVGRRGELAVLDEAWRTVQAGRRRLVCLTGEAGIGRSRLATEFGRRAYDDGAVVLAGRDEPEVLVPYRPVVEALRGWLRDRTPGELRSVLQGEAAELGRLLPEVGTALGVPARSTPASAEPEAERLRLFAAIEQTLAAIAARSPVVLILDDLHWAARPTVLLLRHLLRGEVGALFVVLTWRSDEVAGSPLADILGDITCDPDATVLSLAGLEPEEIAAMLRDRGIDGEAVAWMHAESGGNPLFALELATHVSGPIGPVASMIEQRVGRLSSGAEAALRVAAVVGLEFDMELLAYVPDAGVDAAAVTAALEEAVTAGLIAPVPDARDRYRFSHGLVRRAVYEDLTRTRRVRLHRRVAAAWAAMPADRLGAAAARAHHHVAGAHPDDVDQLVEATLLAAKQAEDALAFEEAVFHLDRAIAAVATLGAPLSAAVGELRLASGRARWLAFDGAAMRDEVEVAVEAARACASADLLARAACLYAEWAHVGSGDARAIALLEEARAELPDDQVVLRARVLALLAWHGQLGSLAWAERRSIEALELARAVQDREALCFALFARMAVLNGVHPLDELELADELYALARDPLDVNLVMYAHRTRPTCLLTVARVEDVRAELEELRAIGGQSQRSLAKSLAAVIDAQILLLEGRYDEAQAAAEQVLEHSGGDENFVNAYAGQSFWLACERGALAMMLPVLDDLVEGGSDVVAFRVGRARARLAVGDADGARNDLLRVAADDFATLPRDPAYPGVVCELVNVAADLGELGVLAGLRGRMEPWSGLLVPMSLSHVEGAGDRFLAMVDAALGDHERADARFAAALALEESVGARPLAARTRWRWGQALVARGEAERASDLLVQARAEAEALGMQL